MCFGLEIVLSCLPRRDLPLLGAALLTCPQVTQSCKCSSEGRGFTKTTFGTGGRCFYGSAHHSTNQTVYNVTRAGTNFSTSPEHASGMCSVSRVGISLCLEELGCGQAVVSSQTSSQVVQNSSPPSSLRFSLPQCSQPKRATTKWTMGKALTNPSLRLGHEAPTPRNKEKRMC